MFRIRKQPPLPIHVPGTNKGRRARSPARPRARAIEEPPVLSRRAAHSTGLDSDERQPIDPRMPQMPPVFPPDSPRPMHQPAQNLAASAPRSPLARLQRLARPRQPHDAASSSRHRNRVRASASARAGKSPARCLDACAILFQRRAHQALPPRPARRFPAGGFSVARGDVGEPAHSHQSGVFLPRLLISAERVVAMYPSPAGATESLLTMESWSELTEANPVLLKMQSDVEALAHQPPRRAP